MASYNIRPVLKLIEDISIDLVRFELVKGSIGSPIKYLQCKKLTNN